ncbi:MAG: hypothetical protein ACFCAD_21625 [Pleurocapsa sp.]
MHTRNNLHRACKVGNDISSVIENRLTIAHPTNLLFSLSPTPAAQSSRPDRR